MTVMQARRIQGLKYQLNHQIASQKKAMYILIGITACVITIPPLTQTATRAFWQIVLEVTSELIALAIASKIREVKLK
ncbi:MAG TPA: hypothetical protein DCE56_03395 [Cyanobacteria bacterium UBA8553]|jgi:hypothetical protein|nr:hypothetical protein [Cyanobacteria bacterium UBA8553]